MPYFKPYEIFDQDTTNAVMAALLIHDVLVNKNESQLRRTMGFKYLILLQVNPPGMYVGCMVYILLHIKSCVFFPCVFVRM